MEIWVPKSVLYKNTESTLFPETPDYNNHRYDESSGNITSSDCLLALIFQVDKCPTRIIICDDMNTPG